jgi:hypothetical protein
MDGLDGKDYYPDDKYGDYPDDKYNDYSGKNY